ncbi:hypothetical protein HYY73_05910 [Candidatus Woesearchaeota archaeon]|nr:hypothetical protein [Candidatus Woesearchaeota archaeon]
MKKEEVVLRPSGLSMLSQDELVEYQGKCLGIVEGKVKFSDADADKVLRGLMSVKSEDKVFTCVPNIKATMVK